MEKRDINKMTNAEIRQYQESLSNEYERIKADIDKELTRLDELDQEWVRTETILNNRKKPII